MIMEKAAKLKMLKALLEAEITALEYYRIHAEAIADAKIAEGIRAIIPAEEAHVQNLAQRIRDLGDHTLPDMDAAVRRGVEMAQESKEKGTVGMLRMELFEEKRSIRDYADGVAEIEDDMVTLNLLEEQLLDEMQHARWLKRMLSEGGGLG
jgi:bacterioferritin (cytochrome b1)